MTQILLVLTTVATQADAQVLARSMVEQRLAACAHIEAIDSVYRWQGAVQQEGEWRLLLKTT
ncbi:MAG: divalent-cation tolerance protein CutA, partial [Ottowia sp.]|nr:divalent-cation tolerance protein CutA [Ottowia sp.]